LFTVNAISQDQNDNVGGEEIILEVWHDMCTYICHSMLKSFVYKVKQFHYMPGQALRVPGGSEFQILRQLAHKGGKVIRPTQRPPLLLRKYSWYSFLLKISSKNRNFKRET
jgi:hypothetical protein